MRREGSYLRRQLWLKRRERSDRKAKINRMKDGKAKTAQVLRQRKVITRIDRLKAALVRNAKLGYTVSFDGTPTFRGLALMLQDCRDNGWTGSLQSADRRPGVPERYGKMSQLRLWLGWIAHKAGFNPANPPGRGTHELRSDGVPYPGPIGRPLAWWQLGEDATEAALLRTVATRLGYELFRPYADPREEHHNNLRKSPKATLKKRGII